MIYTHSDFISVTQFPIDGLPLGMQARFTPALSTQMSYGSDPNTNLSLWRFYVPPNTIATTGTILLTQPQGGTEGYIIVRQGVPPEGDYSQYTGPATIQEKLDMNTRGFREADLLSGDCIGRNASGFMTMIAGPFAKGGWIYGILRMRMGSPTNGIFSFTVNSAQYTTWYNAASWDAFGDPPEGTEPVIALEETDFESIHASTSSFKDSYNLEDPIVTGMAPVIAEEATYTSLHQTVLPTGIGFKDQGKVFDETTLTNTFNIIRAGNLDRFKLFVPGGTISLSITAEVIFNETYCYVGKLNALPTTEFPASLDQLRLDGFTQTEYEASDCTGKNLSNSIVFTSEEVLATTEGKWLYIKLNNSNIQSITVETIVDTVNYLSWYSAAKWSTNGDPVVVFLMPVIYKEEIKRYSPYSQYFTQHIKAFIPPGCVYFALSGLSYVGYEAVVVARFKSKISKYYTSYVDKLTTAQYKALKLDVAPYTLTGVLNIDSLRANGTTTAVPNIWDYSNTPLTTDIANVGTTGGWLYLSLYLRSGSHPGLSIQYSLHSERFLEWYKNVLWDSTTGDPISTSSGSIVNGNLSVSTNVLNFNLVDFNTVTTKNIVITSTYTTNVSARIFTEFKEVTFSEASTFVLEPNVPKTITSTYTAKTVGIYNNYFTIEILNTPTKLKGKIICECVEPPEVCLITSDVEYIIFETVPPDATVSTGLIKLNSTYDTACNFTVENIPTGVTVTPTTHAIDNITTQEVALEFSYTSNKNLDDVIYVTSAEHSIVSIPIRLYCVCTNKEEDLVIVQNTLFDFGTVKLGTELKKYLTICSKYTELTEVTISCTSTDIRLSTTKLFMEYKDTLIVEVIYSPKVENTNIDDAILTVSWLSSTTTIPLLGDCPVYVSTEKPTTLLVDAISFRRAELNLESDGIMALINNKAIPTKAILTYPAGFSGPAGPIEVMPGEPTEISIAFTPTESRKYTGNIVVVEEEA